MPQDKLLKYLEGITDEVKPNETPGMDSSVVATKYPDLYNISTTDFFYPSVEDPELQGRIAACNVLSDLYAMAVTEVDTTLMILAVSTDMAQADKDIVTAKMMKGFADTCKEAGTACTGGQTVQNPWPVVGGVGISLRHEKDFIRPHGAVPGDVLVLTKPLGTQVAVNVWQWRDQPAKFGRVSHFMTPDRAARAYDMACESMGRLNARGAALMHKYGAHGATDVTGFGIMGHCANLAQHTAAGVHMEIHTLPIIADMVAVDAAIGGTYRLLQGRSAETSGGLLVALPSVEAAEGFIKEISEGDGQPAWIIGSVKEGERTAAISPSVRVIEV